MNQQSYALVTGASSGIGECFARSLAARKRNLVLVARSTDKLRALATELQSSHGILAEPLTSDLSQPEAGIRLADLLAERGFAIDLLINNAGFGARGEFWKLPLERQSAMMRLQIETTVELTFCLLPPMITQCQGGLINVSSMTGFQPIPYATTYSATKAFVTSFSMGLREELRPYGIAVVTVCPGGTRTNFVTVGARHGRHRFPGSPQPPEEVVAEALKQLDLGGGLVVPRFLNKASVFSQRFFPRSLAPKVLARMNRP
ncbi:MAG: SDR family oxidoreductase [Acidobacteria bacterium]|nr:SDR family oxidoreductase [Acidobacteriota bacterium]